ncbi:MAG: hypothetical protein EAZ30_08820 [Betaproteobacteria bacterium]|nr:MAG: hypothetical protein EAZ30_08820 [Betaproteobacteria bacterium]
MDALAEECRDDAWLGCAAPFAVEPLLQWEDADQQQVAQNACGSAERVARIGVVEVASPEAHGGTASVPPYALRWAVGAQSSSASPCRSGSTAMAALADVWLDDGGLGCAGSFAVEPLLPFVGQNACGFAERAA